MTPEHQDLDIKELHQVYDFSRKRFSLTPQATWISLRLKHIWISGVRTLVRTGDRPPRRKDFSLNTVSLGYQGKSLENKLGAEDSGYERIEALDILQGIAKSGHLDKEQSLILEKVLNGKELDDDDEKMLATAIRAHPELMELLNGEDEN